MNRILWRARARTAALFGCQVLSPLALLGGCAAERITSGPTAASDSLTTPMGTTPFNPARVLTAATHEPAGFKPLLVLPLTAVSGNGSGPVGVKSWAGNYSLVADAQRGSVMECAYPATLRGGSPACTIWGDEPAIRSQNVSRIYLRMWVKPSLGFRGHTSGVNKLAYVGFGTGGNQFFLSLGGIGGASLRLRMNAQGVAAPLPYIPPGQSWNGPSCTSSGSCSWSPPATGAVITRGAWSLVELLLVDGPAGSKTSSMTAWTNGLPAGVVTGFDFLLPAANGTNTRSEKLTISTYWGGTGGTVGNPPFTIRLSDYYASGAP